MIYLSDIGHRSDELVVVGEKVIVKALSVRVSAKISVIIIYLLFADAIVWLYLETRLICNNRPLAIRIEINFILRRIKNFLKMLNESAP